MRNKSIIALFMLAGIFSQAQNKNEFVTSNENLIAENILPIPKSLGQAIKKYSEGRNASLADIHPNGKEILAVTRFGSTNQLHKIITPMGARKQITFFEEPVNTASYEPTKGEYLVYSKDTGGNEFGQLYSLNLKTMESKLLTDGGRSQNGGVTWKKDGSGFYFTSTKRNGGDRDIYYMNPLKPEETQSVLELKGGGWGINDISDDNKKLLITEYVSANDSYLYIYDLDTKKLEPITDRKEKGIVQLNASFGKNPDEIYYVTDRDNEFSRLAIFNLKTKKNNYLTTSIPWNVESYDLSKDKSKLTFITNESGINKLYILDTNTQKYAAVSKIPVGLIGGGKFSGDGKNIYFSQSTANSGSDIYKLDIASQNIERWTDSELGEMQPADMAIPKLIDWKSFDGMKITGFYYPASAKFTGKRPVLISIHGGPEGQSMASSLGGSNYFSNEMGIALIYPNVRGSSGFGKTYIAADNGYLRMNSVKDIGALLDWIAQQPELDKDRIMITGGSYGGFMTLATAYEYADRIRCSMDVVGISDFNTFLKNTEEYRRDLRRVEYGDERIPKMAEFFTKIAPLNNIDKIKKPMFIVQGTNDPRVPVSEAIQMRDKLKGQGKTVWYLEAKNEGHGFRKKENVDFQRLAMIRFMQEYLLK
ncbi:S9 family peptidase [Chryseobacterium joostei]|uniref:Dipeptidyl aminopeptidase/acylaminoacyl peptidase n=1 Tax=Chryseobacterium joostei TaxID=112234 RepID=A0A1N7I160_9FLAO|nr:prolyl oligopeptidase family serine peptidase [Chryseobacterium joostei]AZA99405.1 S9 family peptidase [Chryseobacterium joostei]SIS30748.1 Dipeptidyl aminopeptidase/acylaminoacyl peptidase [Chryseobacterium joostei]SIS46792.1 Dipeptidyl aminopeptidase/acylaminoacyl peptidase [Chryseobacterium joostei]